MGNCQDVELSDRVYLAIRPATLLQVQETKLKETDLKQLAKLIESGGGGGGDGCVCIYLLMDNCYWALW